MVGQQHGPAGEAVDLVAEPFHLGIPERRRSLLVQRVPIVLTGVHPEELPRVVGGPQAEVARLLAPRRVPGGVHPVDEVVEAQSEGVVIVVARDRVDGNPPEVLERPLEDVDGLATACAQIDTVAL